MGDKKKGIPSHHCSLLHPLSCFNGKENGKGSYGTIYMWNYILNPIKEKGNLGRINYVIVSLYNIK